MTTKFYEILSSDLPAHQEHFLACHQKNMPGNELSVMTSVDSLKSLVKVNCDEPLQDICGDCPLIAIYTLEEARTLLDTTEWKPARQIGE